MDPVKVGIHPDEASNTLEKGCLEAQPLSPEACHGQPVQTRDLRSIAKRHWIVLGTVVLTWLAFSYGMRVFHDPALLIWSTNKMGPLRPPPHGDAGRPECVSGTNWTTYYNPPSWTQEYPYGAETTFSLPLDSDVLYLISEGPLQHGLVNIEQSTEVVDTVDVRVRVAYHDIHLLELATVCQLEGEGDGVGIFTPPRHVHGRPHHQPRYKSRSPLEFDVTLTLPEGSEGPLSVKKLETRLPDYSQNVADIQESVVFEEISLSSANGRLTVESITSEVGRFSVANGEIEGNFNARSSLELNTLNGRIVPTVELLHREGADPTNLVIHTTNGQIDAEVSLTSETLVGGKFGVNAQSRNGQIGLTFVETPVDSILQCDVETTVGAVEVELDSAFEGTYSLRSVLGPKIVAPREFEDPTGRGRYRLVTENKSFGQVAGEVKWIENDGSSSDNEGYVAVKAVSASVKLVV